VTYTSSQNSGSFVCSSYGVPTSSTPSWHVRFFQRIGGCSLFGIFEKRNIGQENEKRMTLAPDGRWMMRGVVSLYSDVNQFVSTKQSSLHILLLRIQTTVTHNNHRNACRRYSSASPVSSGWSYGDDVYFSVIPCRDCLSTSSSFEMSSHRWY